MWDVTEGNYPFFLNKKKKKRKRRKKIKKEKEKEKGYKSRREGGCGGGNFCSRFGLCRGKSGNLYLGHL
jgi:hypothetical protein